MVPLSEPVIALVGVAIGGLLGAAGALGGPWVTSTLAGRRFREELEWRRIDELAGLMDDAGLALERFHWSLMSAIDGFGSSRWEGCLAAANEARDNASSLGSRLAIRLGPRAESAVVDAYDEFQTGYKRLLTTVLDRKAETLDVRALREELDRWSNHDRYFMAARSKREELGQQLVTGVRSPPAQPP
jgi:hypothetical protein